MSEWLRDAILPESCLLCGKRIRARSGIRGLCPCCAAKLPLRMGRRMCIRVLNNRLLKLLTDKERIWAESLYAVAALDYIDDVPQGIRRLKFAREIRWLGMFGDLTARALQRSRVPFGDSNIMLCPMPMSRRSERKRGFNQASLLAESVSNQLGIGCATGILEKRDGNIRHSELAEHARFEASLRAFSCARPAHAGAAKLLLVDDVLSSGSTLYGAARCLLDAGYEVAGALVAASGRKDV